MVDTSGVLFSDCSKTFACLSYYLYRWRRYISKAKAAMGVSLLWLVNNGYVALPSGKVVWVISTPFVYE